MTGGSTGLTEMLRNARPQSAFFEALRNLWGTVRQLKQRRTRALRLCESLPLGERRFVAVVEYANFRFLLGGTSASLVLLARLPDCSTSEGTSPKLPEAESLGGCAREVEGS